MPAFTGHTTGQADFPHPALGQDFTLSRATPSAASEHLLELIGFPITRSFTTYCVCLELRSLPSTGAQLRLEWRGQHGQNKTDQRDHRASLADSIVQQTRIGFS